MKKKLAMRIASLALCVVFTGMLFGAPKSKAVATEVAVGTAAVASYFQATGLTMAASAGSTGALVTSGIADIAGSYAMATGAASSGSAFLSSVATGVSLSSAGAIVLTAAAVVAIGALVAWYVSENGLDEEGDSAVAVLGTASVYQYGSVRLPSIYNVCSDKDFYPYAHIIKLSGYYYVYFLTTPAKVADNRLILDGYYEYSYFNNSWCDPIFSYNDYGTEQSLSSVNLIWSSYDLLDIGGSVFFSSVNPIPVGEDVSDHLEVVRAPEFTQPDTELDAESQKQMVIDAGFAPGTTLDAVASQVPNLIAAGTLAPTYEITGTQTGEGEGEKPEDGAGADGATVGLLQSILEKVKVIPDAIAKGVADVFTPSQEAVDSLSVEVDAKLPFIPELKNFGADLAYNLEHPEECVDEIGFTTIVDLGKGRGTELGNAKIDLLDVSWYLEYKPFVDDVIVGFVWLMFLWNLYGELPRIIHGEGSFAKMYGIIEASRKEENGP